MGEGPEEIEDYDSDGCSSLTSSAFGEQVPSDSSTDDTLIYISDILDFLQKITRKKRVDLNYFSPNLRAFVQKAQMIVKNPEAAAISSASCKRLKKYIIKARKHLIA